MTMLGWLRPMQDAVIGKKVYRIGGSIPAANYVKLPAQQPLCLTGRFAYLQARSWAGGRAQALQWGH